MVKKMMLLKDAAETTGLSQWELRTGALSGKYPSMRVGGKRGKLVFDIELLQEHIKKMMLRNVRQDQEEIQTINGIRRIQ